LFIAFSIIQMFFEVENSSRKFFVWNFPIFALINVNISITRVWTRIILSNRGY